MHNKVVQKYNNNLSAIFHLLELMQSSQTDEYLAQECLVGMTNVIQEEYVDEKTKAKIMSRLFREYRRTAE